RVRRSKRAAAYRVVLDQVGGLSSYGHSGSPGGRARVAATSEDRSPSILGAQAPLLQALGRPSIFDIYSTFHVSRLSRALSFANANRSKSDRAALAGPMIDTSMPVTPSMATTFMLAPNLVSSKYTSRRPACEFFSTIATLHLRL